MNPVILLFILFSVSLSATAQITLKIGMSKASELIELNSSSIYQSVKIIISNFHVLGGLALYFMSAIVWLYVLSKVDVSIAYPTVSLGFVITMILAYFFLGESFSFQKISGALLIASGIFFITKG